MKKVERGELSDWQTYADRRDEEQAHIFAIKAPRRVHLGAHLLFLFENRATIRYQVQEMMRVERIVREADIRHELETYNAVLGGPGELGASLLIAIEDEAARPGLLEAWLGLQEHLYLRLEDGERAYARFDAAQVGERRLSAVQYLIFDCGDRTPVAIGSDHPAAPVSGEAELGPQTLAALREDLDSDPIL